MIIKARYARIFFAASLWRDVGFIAFYDDERAMLTQGFNEFLVSFVYAVEVPDRHGGNFRFWYSGRSVQDCLPFP